MKDTFWCVGDKVRVKGENVVYRVCDVDLIANKIKIGLSGTIPLLWREVSGEDVERTAEDSSL